MTASRTPNLGLMSPVRADAFQPQDFRDTFSILDNNPGVLVIPNQASRPTGYGSDQHGRVVWQADLNIMWVWTQPNAAMAGYWERLATKGHLGGGINGDTVSSSAQSVATSAEVTGRSVMCPGGRPIFMFVRWGAAWNDHSGQITLNVFANNDLIREERFNGVSWGVASGTDRDPTNANTWIEFYNPGSTQRQVNFHVAIRAQDPSVVGPVFGGGTSHIRRCSIDVIEM